MYTSFLLAIMKLPSVKLIQSLLSIVHFTDRACGGKEDNLNSESIIFEYSSESEVNISESIAAGMKNGNWDLIISPVVKLLLGPSIYTIGMC